MPAALSNSPRCDAPLKPETYFFLIKKFGINRRNFSLFAQTEPLVNAPFILVMMNSFKLLLYIVII